MRLSFSNTAQFSRLLAGALLTAGLLSSLAPSAAAQSSSGAVAGRVTDASGGEPLPGANVVLQGTSLGAATGAEGRYRLAGVPAGEQTIRVTYVGYQPLDTTITVPAGGTARLNASLRLDVVEGQEVVVTALLEGQQRAINQQLSSNKIVEIVSSDRIEELPEANVAEAVGRLSGVSLQRDAGEGQKVVVRGLSPELSSVTLDGERIPSTEGQDRSVDLSMIAPEMLGGIELFKALTPDQDADAIGGSVNLRLKEAPAGFRGRVKAQTGYNALQDAYLTEGRGPFKITSVLSDRFASDRLGVMVTGNVERANRSSDNLDGDYDYVESDREFKTINANLSDVLETRYRYGGSAAMDYQFENGQFKLRGLFSSTERDQIRRRLRYRVESSRVERDAREFERTKRFFSGAFSGEHAFQHIEIDYQTSVSYSGQKQPFGFFHRFRELGAFEGAPEGVNIGDLPPAEIPQFANNNLANTFYDYTQREQEDGWDRDATSAFNAKVPFRLGDGASGFLKLGVKYRDKARTYDQTVLQTPDNAVDDIAEAQGWTVDSEGRPLFENFADASFEANDFLDNRFAFGPGLNVDQLNAFAEANPNLFARNIGETELDDYEAGERVLASYLMAEVTFLGRKLMVLPGYRLEQTTTDYLSYVGEGITNDLNIDLQRFESGAITIEDTTGGQDYTSFLPMLHVRYRFSDAVSLRGAVTRTLARPNYYDLVFYENLNPIDATGERGNPALEPTTSWNYDLFGSYYNRLGLFTAGVFYKRLANPIYDTLLPEEITRPGLGSQTYVIEQPVNGSDSEIYGFEVSVQANLTFLPGLLSGFVTNVNYAYTGSTTRFPELVVNRLPDGRQDPDDPFSTVEYEGKLPDQKPHVLNASLGYERLGFTARVSLSYQSAYTSDVGVNRESSSTRRAFTFWDATVSQALPGRLGAAEVYFNLNNFTSEFEGEYINRGSRYVRDDEIFGWTADLGVKYKL